ncbi:MAG TPA: AAA family ATPase [Thermoanaerobaculia bacterium]|nr:AAA family ATPase [Thermoanaerobaculia bacterium]
MFLKKLVLEDVRSIEHLELPFLETEDETRKWTFLLGENGTGKSTVLKAVALVLAGSDALPELLVEPESWIRVGARGARIQAELVTAQGEERRIGLDIRRGENLFELFERNRDSLRQLDAALRHTSRSYLTVGYGVSRRLSDPRYAGSRPSIPFQKLRARSVATLFSPDAELNPLQNWAIDLHYRLGDEGLELIRETLGRLLPNVELSRIDRDTKTLLFATPDGEIPLGMLSDGYQNVAAWCGDLLYNVTQVFEDYKEPLSARGLLLIDEVDLHLHPVWQRQLKRFLDDKLPNFQIVATTHSPLTAHQAGEGELFFLQRDEPSRVPVLHRYAGSPRQLMIHQVLVSPVFGLATMDSERVEEMRREYENLSKQDRRTRVEERRMRQLAEELQDLPEWNAHTELEQKRAAVLEDIARALQAK